MGKRGKKILGAFRKIFSPESNEKKGEISNIWGIGKSKHYNPYLSEKVQYTAPAASSSAAPQPVLPLPHLEEIKLAEAEQEEQEQRKHFYSVVIASAAAAEASVAAAQAAAEVVLLNASANLTGNSREVAAIKIQTAFRGYLARRALRALKGLVRLKSLIHGNVVKRQAATTLRCMQTLARIQSQIHSRRIRMLEENQTLQRQLLLKSEKELESMRMSDEWDDSVQSKEQIEASFSSKKGALMRRERALAYAFSHQWKSPSMPVNPTFMDANNPQWGWSWLERWMTARPWESRSDKELNGGGEMAKVSSYRNGILDRKIPSTPRRSTRPPSRQSPATPPSKALSGTGKNQSASPRNGWHPSGDDTRSLISLQSERPRRHSLAGSSIRDDESLTSSMTLPSYMAPTESAKAKNRRHGLLGDIKIETNAAKDSAVKKRLSFQASPAEARRRHSAPARVDPSVAVKRELNGRNVEKGI